MSIFLITFTLLTLIQIIVIWVKWQSIKEYQEIGDTLAKATGIDKHYSNVVLIIGNLLRNFKKVLIIPIGIILILNLVFSFLVYLILDVFILGLISLFM